MGHISNRVHLALWGCLRLLLGMAKRCTSAWCTKMLSNACLYASSALVFRSAHALAQYLVSRTDAQFDVIVIVKPPGQDARLGRDYKLRTVMKLTEAACKVRILCGETGRSGSQSEDTLILGCCDVCDGYRKHKQ